MLAHGRLQLYCRPILNVTRDTWHQKALGLLPGFLLVQGKLANREPIGILEAFPGLPNCKKNTGIRPDSRGFLLLLLKFGNNPGIF